MKLHPLALVTAAVACLAATGAISCKSNKKKEPEPYVEGNETPKSIGVVITTLDKLLLQWNDAMSRPETRATFDLRLALLNEIRKTVTQRFDDLKNQLETSVVIRNREIVAAALGFSMKPEALNPLVSAATQDPVPAVREKALLGLSRLADLNTPIDLVASRLSIDFTDGEQWNASLALKNLAQAGAKMDVALPALRAGLGNRNPAIRVHCAAALGAAKDKLSTPLLVTLLKDDRALVAAAAAAALGIIGEPSTAGALVDSLGSNEYAVRTETRKALVRMNGGQDLGQEIGPWRRWQQHLEMTTKSEAAAEAANSESRPASRPAEVPATPPATGK